MHSSDDNVLDATGERYVPQLHGEIEIEHVHRYALAAELAAGRRVLDLACGEGYGASLLADVARSVVGVDADAAAIEHARASYERSGLEFRVGRCAALPLPDASIDLVVSFETIEHHDEHEEMLDEVTRVLAPDGLLVISTPDKHQYSDLPRFRNPFHVKELYRDQFEALLTKRFGRVALYGQRVRLGSVIAPIEGSRATPFLSFSGSAARVERTGGIAAPVYLLALASNAPLPGLPAGVFEGGPWMWAPPAPDEPEPAGEGAARHDVVQVFAPTAGGYAIESSVSRTIVADGRSRGLTFVLPYDGSGPLRIDPATSLARIDLHAVTVRLTSEGGERVAHWKGYELERAPLAIAGAIRLDTADALRIVAVSDDPQLHLDLGSLSTGPAECRLDLMISLAPLQGSPDPVLAETLTTLDQMANSAAEARLLAMGAFQREHARAEHLLQERERLEVLAATPAEAQQAAELARGEALAARREADAWRERARAIGTELAEHQRAADDLRERLTERGREAPPAPEQVDLEVLTRLKAEVNEATTAKAAAERQLGLLSGHLTAVERAFVRFWLSRGSTLGWALVGPLRSLLSARRLAEATGRSVGRTWLSLVRHGREAELLSATGLFDADHYRSQAGPQAAAVDPVLHYLTVGTGAGLNPHPLFDTRFYLESNPDVARGGINPLVHFVLHGDSEGRPPHPLFDPSYYRSQAGSLGDASPLVHFLRHGGRGGLNPSAWFDSTYYLDSHDDVLGSGMNPLVHWVSFGATEGRDPSPWFDTAYYLRANPDVAAAGVNPLVHFALHGLAEGRRPNRWFDPQVYLRANPDVAQAGVDAVCHLVTAGFREGRACSRPPASTIESMDTPAEPPGAQPPAGKADEKADEERSIKDLQQLRELLRQHRAEELAAVSCRKPTLVSLPRGEALAAATKTLCFTAADQPRVSIVIPVLDNVALTAECLESIVRHTTNVSHEVIVFDNGSTDETPALLSEIPNLVYLRSEENTGFGPACNRAAEAARGEYLVFLNNDAQVTAGWLDALCESFEQGGRVGVTGPRVLYPDGRLQEAGAAIGPDGSSILVGLFDDPDLPAYGRTRQVDYVSGVCLMIPARVFRELGGFSAEFAPAYYEDADLCLRLHARGLKVIYNPGSTVVHRMSATSSAGDSMLKGRLVTRNQQRLVERHQGLIDELNSVRLIAFYLPQFHPIPENDLWWGKGFTEWRNVVRARPNFAGHYQPRLPADLGFYDLRLPEVMTQQMLLARRYGIGGFCFYYYWFNGRRLLGQPIDTLLASERAELPFCLAWANENWTRTWDGSEDQVLVGQAHSEEDDLAVIRDLIRFFRHRDYIRVEGRPLLVVYRPELFPDVCRTTAIWREECRRQKVGDPYLALVESFERAGGRCTNPATLGFDAAIEFPPHGAGTRIPVPEAGREPSFRGETYSYPQSTLTYASRALPDYVRFRTAMPGWDNTPRRQETGVVFVDSTPGAYEAWLEAILRQTRELRWGDERLVFVNAWNEWAEGAYLEPDARWGHAYLEATRRALARVRLGLS